VCPAGFRCDLCMVDVPHSLLLAADAVIGSLVYTTNNYCQHQVITAHLCH